MRLEGGCSESDQHKGKNVSGYKAAEEGRWVMDHMRKVKICEAAVKLANVFSGTWIVGRIYKGAFGLTEEERRRHLGRYAWWYHALKKHVKSEKHMETWLQKQDFDNASKAVIRKAQKKSKGRNRNQVFHICEALGRFWANALKDGGWVESELSGIYITDYVRAFENGEFWYFTHDEIMRYMGQLVDEQEISILEGSHLANLITNYYT